MNEKLFIKYDEYQKENGVYVVKYKKNPKLKDIKIYVDAVDIKTGNIKKKEVVEYSEHRNISMYKVEHKDDLFEVFYVSEDHSLIVFDTVLDRIRKARPLELISNPDRYFLLAKLDDKKIKEFKDLIADYIYKGLDLLETSKSRALQNILKQKIILIPTKDLKIEKSNDINVAYDLTVKDYYTFTTSDGVFVQDTMGVYFVSSKEAIEDLDKAKCHALYIIKNLQNDTYIHKYRHESLYALYILTRFINPDKNKKEIVVESLEDLEIDYNYFDKLDTPVRIKNLNNLVVSYGIAVINKILFNDKVLINEPIDKKNVTIINEKLYTYLQEKYKDKLSEKELNKLYLDTLHELLLFLISFLTVSKYNPYIHENDYIVYDDIVQRISELPDEPYIGILKYSALVDETIEKMKEDNSILYHIYKSGARASKDQIKQVVVAKGYIANDFNVIIKSPIKANLMQGLNEDELFISSFGTRKGLIDKSDFTPVSGYLERTMIMNASIVDIDKNCDDCKTDRYLEIKVFDEKHAKSLIGRYYFDDEKGALVKITKDNYLSLVNKQIKLRSPMYCKCKDYKICKTCAGDFPTHLHLGMVSACFISERFTQLTLRTFHISAAANIKPNPALLEVIDLNKIKGNKYLGSKEEIKKINEYLDKYVNNSQYKVYIDENTKEIISNGKCLNPDIITTIKTLNSLLMGKVKKVHEYTPEKIYTFIIKEYLKHSFIKSLYIETILSLLFMDKKTKTLLRYMDEINLKKVEKVSIKYVSRYINKMLAFLYEPNKTNLLELILDESENVPYSPFIELVK